VVSGIRTADCAAKVCVVWGVLSGEMRAAGSSVSSGQDQKMALVVQRAVRAAPVTAALVGPSRMLRR